MSTIETFAVAADKVNNRIVMVGLDSDNRVWWKQLSLPATSAFAWTAPQYVSLSGAQSPIKSISLATAPITQGLVCCIATYSGIALFRIGDTSAVLLPLPSGIPYARQLQVASAVSPSNVLQFYFVGEDLRDTVSLHYEKVNVTNWPPVVASPWENWDDCSNYQPGLVYGPSTMWLFDIAPGFFSGNNMWYCWCYSSDLDYGIWWSLSSPSSGASFNGNAVGMNWLNEEGQPQEGAIFCRGSDDKLYYIQQTTKDGRFSGSWKTVPNITTTYDPVFALWTNFTYVVVNVGGRLRYSSYMLKEDHFSPWSDPIAGLSGVKNYSALIFPIFVEENEALDSLAIFTITQDRTAVQSTDVGPVPLS